MFSNDPPTAKLVEHNTALETCQAKSMNEDRYTLKPIITLTTAKSDRSKNQIKFINANAIATGGWFLWAEPSSPRPSTITFDGEESAILWNNNNNHHQ